MSGEENCENCGSIRLKEFKYREGYGCWDCGYTSDDKDDKMACSECDSFVEDGSCLCGKTRIETSEKSYADTYNEIQRGLDKLRDAVKDQDWNRAKTFVGFTESKIEELEEITQGESGE